MSTTLGSLISEAIFTADIPRAKAVTAVVSAFNRPGNTDIGLVAFPGETPLAESTVDRIVVSDVDGVRAVIKRALRGIQ